MFNHLGHCAGSIGDDPAIGGAFGRAEAQHCHLGAVQSRAEPGHRGARQERHIAKADQHQSGKISQRILGHKCRMGGAELRFLHHHFGTAVGQRRFDLFAAVPRDDNLPRRAQFAQIAEQVQQHRVPRDWVEHLVQIALHTGALACGEDDDG